MVSKIEGEEGAREERIERRKGGGLAFGEDEESLGPRKL